MSENTLYINVKVLQVRLQHTPDLEACAKIVSLLPFQLLLYVNCVQILQLMLPHIIFHSLCKEMKQQMEEQTTIFVQITYKSHKEVPRHFPVVPKHMVDICTSDCLAVICF